MDESALLEQTGGEDSDLPLDSDKCFICLNPFEKQAVASLEKCPHVFCLECILRWSQTANTCPVDRISFAYIHCRPCLGGDIEKKIKVMTQKSDDEEQDRGDPVFCEQCGESDRRHRMLMCTMCDVSFHIDCLPPPVDTDPEGGWMCPECAYYQRHEEGFMVEEEISDGEVTDLLVEGETASTSTRLRLSTISLPYSSTERRQSPRLQSRASSDPDPRPQTSWRVPQYLLRASEPPVTTDEVAARHDSDDSNASVKLKTGEKRKRAN